MYFDYNLPISAIVIFASALAMALLICLVYCRGLYLVRRRNAACNVAPLAEAGDLPSVSIVIYARGEAEALSRLLPQVLSQSYPKRFDVVVVNEGLSTEIDVLIDSLRSAHPNLYLTFTPDGARNLSRKKLAITIGVKAAKGDVVVVTDATARVESDQWLWRMAGGFVDPSIDVVLGYGKPKVTASRFLGRKVRAFDMCADSVAWLLSAITGRPYRACGYNLAYRRAMFFNNKGFSRSLNLKDGDDDIFVSEIANRHNCVLELATDAYVEEEHYNYKRHTSDFRLSHAFTGRKLYKGTRRLAAASEWGIWIVLIACIVGACLSGVANICGWIAALIIVVGLLICVCVSWRRTLLVLDYPRMGWTLILLVMMRPLRNMFLAWRSHTAAYIHYTWQ